MFALKVGKGELVTLRNVTIVSVAGTNSAGAIRAMQASTKSLTFYAAKLISPQKPVDLPSNILWEESPPLPLRSEGNDAYSKFMIYDLWRHIETPHALIVQADGYVINPHKWSNDFLDFDYIGAPWPTRRDAFIDPFGVRQRVGNGGFSLRSQRLMMTPQTHKVTFDVNSTNFYAHMDARLLHEDGNICVHNRHIFEKAGCIFAPIDVAVRFSQEHFVREGRWITPFGFHRHRPRVWRNFIP